MDSNTSQSASDYPMNTDSFAALNRVKGQSVRARMCRFGHYFGIQPKKLANGRLAWPAVQIEKVGG
jgi:hypothetical protein